jgi:subtilisin family serine protease
MLARRFVGLLVLIALIASFGPGPSRASAATTTRLIVELSDPPAGVARARAVAANAAFDLATYEAALRAKQDAFLAELAARGVAATVSTLTATAADGKTSTVALRWTFAYHGLAIEAPAGAAATIAAMPGVRHVAPDAAVQAFLAESVPYIGAPQTWGLGARGQGQSIADIDTGIDWTHPMFTNDPTLPPGPLHPKVRKYISYTAGLTDDFGHGSHVGGIAAGDSSLGYLQNTPAGVEVPQGKALYDGVAPKADLWGYKVLTAAGSGVTTSIVTAIDDAARSGARVINLSLGNASDDPQSPNSRAVDNAMVAGTAVAVAAGNSGPGYATIGTPATARFAITVGAATDPGDNKFYVYDVTANPQRKMNMILMSNSPRPPTPAIESAYVHVGEGCTPTDYAGKATVGGRIALIKRGTCTFTAKAVLAQSSGALAALIYNNVAGDFSGSMEKTQIPVAGISDVNGSYLVGFTAADGLSNHLLKLDPNPEVIAGQITGFSSRGPTKDYRIKPDVVAPGNTITSATTKTGVPTQSMADPSGYTTAGGTSMATPHVAGAAALLRQLHPAWDPFDVRLALMNTARILTDPADGKPYSIQDQGAGLIDVYAAATTKAFLYARRPDLGVSVTEGSYSFGEVENLGGTVTRQVTFTLRDTSGAGGSYALSWENGDGKSRGGEGRALPAAGFTTAISPATVTVAANGTATFTLTVTANGTSLPDGDYEGRVVATTTGQTLRAPVFFRSVHRGVASFPAPTLSGPAVSDSGTYTLSWTAVPGAVGYRLQQATNPSAPLFGDDAESGLGKWTVGGTTPQAWSATTMRAHSPTQSFVAFQGPSQDNTLTLRTPVTIPAGTNAALSFWTYLDTEPTFDFLHVEASRSGTTWTRLASFDGASDGWVRKDVDLSSFAGGSAYVRFRYITDSLFDVGLYEGAYVDDIAISTSDWVTIAEPATTSYTATGQPVGTYYHRVAGLFDTPSVRGAQGPFSNTVQVVVPRNQIGNGDFEVVGANGQPTLWTASGNTRANNDPALATSGTRSVSVLGTGTATGGSWTSAPIAVTAGQRLTVVVDVVGGGRSSGPLLRVSFLSASGAVLESVSLASGIPGMTLGSLGAEVTVPASAATMTVTLAGFAPTDLATAGTATFDNVRVR